MDDQPNETQDLTNKIDKSGMRKSSQGKGQHRINQTENDVADICRNDSGQELRGLAGHCFLDYTQQIYPATLTRTRQ